MKKRGYRCLCAVLAICLCLTMMPIFANAYSQPFALPTLSDSQANNVAKIALSQLGYAQDSSGGTAYGAWWNTQINWNADYTYSPWCAMFACWCANQAGAGLKVAYNTSSAGVGYLLSFLTNNGTVDTSFSTFPQAGDFIFFCTSPGGGSNAHVAVVVDYNIATNVVTFVGGNQNNKVTRETVVWSGSAKYGSLYVKGYGRPNYTGVAPSVLPGKPVLTGMQSSYASGSSVTFTWAATQNTTHYNVSLYRVLPNNVFTVYEQSSDVTSPFTRTLPDGVFLCRIQAYNSNYWRPDGKDWISTTSDDVYFTVGDHECDRGSYAFFEAVHPHYSCYNCSVCKQVWRDYSATNYYERCLECQRPSKPALLNMKPDYAEGQTVRFTWNSTSNTTHYNMYIDYMSTTGEWVRYENAHYATSGWAKSLPVGEYRALLQATNSYYMEADGSTWLYSNGDYAYFTVSHPYTYTITKIPTSMMAGKLSGTCSHCSAKKAINLPKLNAVDYTYSVVKAATCTAAGIGRYTWKNTQYGTHSIDRVIPATEHSYTKKTTAPTGSQKGYTTFTCACGDSYVKYDTFADVPNTLWSFEAVEFAVEKGYFSGYQSGNFGPTDNITRQDFVVVLARIAKVDLSKYSGRTGFPDVKAGDYYEAAVKWASSTGVVSGYKNGKFGVGDKITREQLVTILYRYAQKMGYDTKVTGNAAAKLAKFSDAGKVTSYAKEAVIWALDKGIISGMNVTSVGPLSNASRGQVATILMNISKKNIMPF